MWHRIVRVLVIAAGLVLAGSFAGNLHPLGDSLAVFRPIILIGTLAVCLLVVRWRVAQALALVAIFLGAWHGAALVFHDGPKRGADLTLYQKNLLFRPTDRTAFIADVRATNADIVTLQEVSRANLPLLDALREDYPYQLLCAAHSVGSVAILSRTPFIGQTCGTEPGFSRAVTQVRGGAVQVYSLHLFWPWPHSQAAQVARILPDMTPLDGGVTVIGGDFNMVATGRSVARIADATGTARVGPVVRTFDLFGYPLGIDHVLATGGVGLLDVRPLLGADHYGLVASIEFSSAP